ncbi:MAG TPA: hypothetical protein VIW69_15890, partial [Candidatus Elarobacter sp.]
TENRYDGLGRITDTIGYAATILTSGLVGGLVDSTIIARAAAAANVDKDAHTTTRYQFFDTGPLREEVRTTSAEGARTFDYFDVFGDLRAHFTDIDTRSLAHSYAYDHRGLRTLTRWDTTEVNPTGVNQTEIDIYDAFGRLTSTTDQYFNTMLTDYDRLGRVIATTDAMSNKNATTYDAFARVLTMTDARQNITTYIYDDVNRIVKIRTPENITVTTTYNRHGQTLSVQDGRSAGQQNTTVYAYDQTGNLKSSSDDLGPIEARAYDSTGRQVTTTSKQPNGTDVVTRFSYDATNRTLTRIADANGLALTTSYTYNDANHTMDVVDPNGVLTRTAYDRDGRVAEVLVDPGASKLNLRTTYKYDLAGHVIKVTQEGFGSAVPRVTQYFFDVLGRRTDEIVDPGTGTNAAGQPYLNLKTHYEYDANGNVVRKTTGVDTADARATRYVYDGDNRLVYTLDAANGVTATTYDKDSHVASARRYANTVNLGGLPLVLKPGDITSDRLSVSSEDRLESYAYDKDGRQIYTINALGGVTQKDYDANGNVVRTVMYARPLASSVTSSAAQDVRDAYWGVNNTAVLTADDRVQWTVYDKRNRAVYSVDAYGAVIRHEYDDAGNVTKTTAYAASITVDTGNNVTSTVYGTALNVSAAVLTKDTLDGWANGAAVAGDANNHATRYWYDALNRVRFTLDAEGYLTETQYAYAPQKITTVVYAANATIAPNAKTADLASRVLGNNVPGVAIAVDPNADQRTTMQYDAGGRVYRI